MNNNYIKSPLNYTGGKYKLLEQILPLFPSKINTFVDLFGGGMNVGININAKKIIYNELDYKVFSLIKWIKETETNDKLKCIEGLIKRFNLNRENKEGYLKLRQYYNNVNNSEYVLYTLITHSFSNQIRFNKKGEFNLPFGKRTFNQQLKNNFIKFSDKLHSSDNIELINIDFNNIRINDLKDNDFIYCDPPYLITMASYNENNRWNVSNENDLISFLDELNNNNIKFGLSNVLYHKGKSNDILINWSKKYNVNFLDYTYNNCNYQTHDKGRSVEVLITNY